MSAQVAAAVDEFRREAHEDYVGLWEIVRHWQDAGSASLDERRDLTLETVRRLLEGGVVAGKFEEGQWRFWPEQGPVALARIETEWTALGHEPDVGEIVWFVLGAAEGSL